MRQELYKITRILSLIAFSCLGIFYCSDSFALFSPAPIKPKFVDNDVSSAIRKDKRMVIFADRIESTDGNVAKTSGSTFAAMEMGILNADALTANKERGKFYATDGVRLRTNQNIILFANNLEYSDKTKLGMAQFAHVFLADNSSILATRIDKIAENIYEMTDVSFSACELRNIHEVNIEKERKAQDYYKSQAILNPVNLKTTVNSEYSDVQKQYSSLPWHVTAERLNIDLNKDEATAYNARAKLLGLTVFKMRKFTADISGGARSGFLTPEFIMLGTRQVGLGIPYYMRHSSYSDTIIMPTLYNETSWLSGKNMVFKDGETLDSKRLRENTLDIEHRYLFYDATDKHDKGLLEISGSATNTTGLIDPNTRLYKTDSEGRILYGNRWHIDAKLELGITKNTYIKGELLKSSDPNYLAIYKLKHTTYARNFIGIVHADESNYHLAEMMRFDPLLINISPSTTPVALPHIRSTYEAKIDDILGGRFLLHQRYANLNRTSGYDSKIYNLEVGYTLPKRTKDGNYFTFFSSGRFDHQDSSFKGYGGARDGYLSTFYTPYSGNTNSIYANPESRMAYNGLIHANGQNFRQNRSYYNLNLDYAMPIFTGIGRFGQFVFEPRIKYKQAPFMNATDMVLEDSLGTQIQRSNLFANNLSDGYGIIDSGKRLSYGVDAYTSLPWYNLKATFGLGVVNYIGPRNTFYHQYNGLGKDFSDYVGTVKISNSAFTFFHEYRTSSKNNIRIFSNAFQPRFQSTGFNFNLKSGLSFGISYNTFSGLPFGFEGEVRTMSPRAEYKFKNNVSLGVMGMRIIQMPQAFPATDVWLQQGFYIAKQENCLYYGLFYIKNNYAIPGVSTSPVVRFKIGITGF